ncbi:hypothetical protein F5Y19DRAFT_479002 [Xylariaceae sp. FL1651]|nr:hypothetical protein F5Y19DRAFT_479002 [Xylariaceae sp. FL1651]
MTEPLAKVDSAVQGLSSSPPKDKSHRKSSSIPGVPSVKEMYQTKTPLKVAAETQKTGWKINTSSSTVEDKDILKKPLITPLADDELTDPYLKGFEWPPEHPSWEDQMARIEKEEDREAEREKEWGTLLIHLSPVPEVSHAGGKKKKKAAE